MSSPRRMGRSAAVLAVLALVLLAAAPAQAAPKLDGDQRSPRVVVTKKALAQSTDLGTSKDPAIGKVAPTLKGLSLTGKPLTIGNDGKPRIVLFLSHACPHCQAEVPEIVKLADQGRLDGVEIDTVTTNTSKSQPNWPPSRWLKRVHWPYNPVLADDSKLSGFIGYGGTAFPYFVFVGADGKVVARVVGEVPADTLAEAARRLANDEPFFAKS